MPSTPPRWDDARLEADRQLAIREFREERMSEPLAVYLQNFERYRDAVENLLEGSADLRTLLSDAADILTDPDLLYAARYISGPPISTDDLRNLSESSLAPSQIRKHPEQARGIAETILLGLDRERFPWLAEHREPTEEERRTTVVATAALIASQRVRTNRANESPKQQEALVKAVLTSAGFQEDPPGPIPNLSFAPAAGHFCGESRLGATRKADIVVRLWDGRLMAIECKVSNSQLNSIKRLNNDAAVKARVWLDDFGRTNIVPSAVLAGVFGLRHLKDSQDRGLSIFWSHSPHEMLAFVASTRHA